jgi:hypothetical protein
VTALGGESDVQMREVYSPNYGRLMAMKNTRCECKAEGGGHGVAVVPDLRPPPLRGEDDNLPDLNDDIRPRVYPR